MSRLTFTIIWVVFASGLLFFMWTAWQARKKRDAGVFSTSAPLSGETVASFPRVSYVSTTPVGQPLDRVALPGLSFKGWAEVEVLRDGVAIEVTGERRVEIPAPQIRGTGAASGRIGKVVEQGGLALLIWATEGETPRELESSFRFTTPAEQRRFTEAVEQIMAASSL